MRIEDLDTPRVVPGMAEDILRTLETLGLAWDGEVLRQSDRTHLYREALDRLTVHGRAYQCGCSRSEIARISSAPHGTSGELRYPGICRDGLPAGKVPRAVRVRVDHEIIRFTDCIMGEVSENLAETCGDFVLRRADGPFAYHLAVVVDDALQGVNQVVRGADLLASTPRQIHLQRLLGFQSPDYCHLPLVIASDGGKLSKRDTPVSLVEGVDIRSQGAMLIHDSLTFLGQPIPLMVRRAPLREVLEWGVAHFDPSLVPRVPAPFPASDPSC